eukprot:g24683.t1
MSCSAYVISISSQESGCVAQRTYNRKMAVEAKAEAVDLETAVSEVSTTDSLAKMQPTKLQRQSSFRRGGVIPTAICLSKAAIGAGVLSVSVHAAEVGALYQLACLMRLGRARQRSGGNERSRWSVKSQERVSAAVRDRR